MIISEQWLRDWVRVDLDADGIADCLTNAGLEVDGVNRLAGNIDNLVVGRVLSVEKHPDADRLKLTKVDIGEQQLEIVCGASNAREGLLVAVATVGAKLPNGMAIKKAKVRGVKSSGMLCSAVELGLEEQSDGILELDEDAQIGQRVDDYLQLGDALIDIDLTPNRGDCLSVQGIARELKVLAAGDYRPLSVEPAAVQSKATIEVDVQESASCPRYLARVIEGVDSSRATPLWMQERLRRSGVHPISVVVDVTNYVMLELGQPMHAFDLAKLGNKEQNKKIVVRKAKKNEKITLLDDSQAELDKDTLVIADNDGAIAIAGVMGGKDSAISDDSKDIVLESAHFTRQSAAGVARRYGLHTESSQRFERGVDIQLPALAMQRATELIIDICGGKAGEINEQVNDSAMQNKAVVELRLSRLNHLLGMPLEQQEVADILSRVSDRVSSNDDNDAQAWQVMPPSYRFDIEREADLIEEVARVKGYDNIPTHLPRVMPTSIVASESRLSTRQVRASMVARDFQEAITYSFISSEAQARFSDEAAVQLTNPLAENMSVMRTSLLPGLLEAVQFNNNRQHQRIRLFEMGASYHFNDTKKSDGHRDGERKYKEVQRLAGVVVGALHPLQWGVDNDQKVDFYDLKSDIQAVISLTGKAKAITFDVFQHKAMHPGQVAAIVETDDQGNKIELGFIGCLHPILQKHYGLNDNVFVFELDIEKALTSNLPEFSGVSRYPSVKRDLSVVVADEIPVTDLLTALTDELGAILSKADVFDIYRGKGVAENSKSVSLSLQFQGQDKTMTDAEIEQLTQQVLNILKAQFNADLRT